MSQEESCQNLLIQAIKNGDTEKLDNLLKEFDFPLNQSLGMSGTLLCTAIRAQQQKIVKYLVNVSIQRRMFK